MRATLLVDSNGPNPDYKPPDPRGGPEAKSAFFVYCATVLQTIVVPAGTILDDPEAWIHCLMDGSGDGRKGIPGIVRAEPADDDCRVVVESEVKKMDPLQRRMHELAVQRAQALRVKQAPKEELEAQVSLSEETVHD